MAPDYEGGVVTFGKKDHRESQEGNHEGGKVERWMVMMVVLVNPGDPLQHCLEASSPSFE